MARIVVAMSGGVDSSVAALLCVREGHDVVGATMVLSPSRVGDTTDSVAEAARVAGILGIPHRVFDFSAAFESMVVGPFCAEYASGRTPNPCVVCNPDIKFGLLLAEALADGADYLATGHYVRVGRSDAGRLTLLRASDETKDQTYALFRLRQDQLAKSLFPLGRLTKREVRTLATEAGLPVAERPESQDLCFATSEGYRTLMAERVSAGFEPGPILDSSGRLIGRHDGIANFTVGQRKGLRLASPEPLYVLAIHPEERSVVVGTAAETLSRGLLAANCNWMAIPGLSGFPIRADVKVRYGSRPVAATVSPGTDPYCAEVVFDSPQRSIAPGQAAVFYHGEELLGGGTIERPIPANEGGSPVGHDDR